MCGFYEFLKIIRLYRINVLYVFKYQFLFYFIFLVIDSDDICKFFIYYIIIIILNICMYNDDFMY